MAVAAPGHAQLRESFSCHTWSMEKRARERIKILRGTEKKERGNSRKRGEGEKERRVNKKSKRAGGRGR